MPIQNDAKKSNEEEYVEEKRSQFMGLVDVSKSVGKTIPFKVFVEMVDAFIRSILSEVGRLTSDKPKVDMASWFYKNCKSQRRREAKICQCCPFRESIEAQEKGMVTD